jgi:trimethylamine--corrinoid protein Co-methyltransferase
MSHNQRPSFNILTESQITRILDEAYDVLEKIGLLIEHQEVVEKLLNAGASTKGDQQRVLIPRSLVESCCASAPSRVELYDRIGNLSMELTGHNVHFDPGSAAINVLDWREDIIRKPNSHDVAEFHRLTDALPNYVAQSTGLIPDDVPHEIADRWRLIIALHHCRKPVVTGTFAQEGWNPMVEMLSAIRGGKDELRKKPLAIFDVCPSPPLTWTKLGCQTLIDGANDGVPLEFVSMPLAGATAPVTLAGALVQHTAETLGGVVLTQTLNTGTPIIYGGSPAVFDMREGTTPMGAIETMMIDVGYNQIGKYLNLPTHAYMGLSDAKKVDTQAGFESSSGAILAALAGINVISGAGMMDFESCQSLVKLVVDHDICGMALRLTQGIRFRDGLLAEDLLGDLTQGDLFLTSPLTLSCLKQEQYIPSPVVDRKNLGEWERAGSNILMERAKERVQQLLSESEIEPLDSRLSQELHYIMETSASQQGFDELPWETAQCAL